LDAFVASGLDAFLAIPGQLQLFLWLPKVTGGILETFCFPVVLALCLWYCICTIYVLYMYCVYIYIYELQINNEKDQTFGRSYENSNDGTFLPQGPQRDMERIVEVPSRCRSLSCTLRGRRHGR